MNPADVAEARKWAAFYRSKGWNPLPSRPDAKRPFVRYADLWDTPASPDLFDSHPTTNIQLMTGRCWRLLVIDLDGREARDRWPRMGRCPQTWVTHSGGDGLHFWFTLPAGLADDMPKAFLWRGEEGHSAVERLCDRSLIMAPPSIHPTTGNRYRFIDRAHSPARMPTPAPCPAWLMRPVRVELPRPAVVPATPTRVALVSSRHFDRGSVLAAIPDKIGLIRSWGVRFDGRRSPSGWVPCHAIDREDRNPSAAVHESTGRYCDLGSGLRLSLFDLAAAMGVYGDWRQAVADLGERYHAREAV